MPYIVGDRGREGEAEDIELVFAEAASDARDGCDWDLLRKAVDDRAEERARRSVRQRARLLRALRRRAGRR